MSATKSAFPAAEPPRTDRPWARPPATGGLTPALPILASGIYWDDLKWVFFTWVAPSTMSCVKGCLNTMNHHFLYSLQKISVTRQCCWNRQGSQIWLHLSTRWAVSYREFCAFHPIPAPLLPSPHRGVVRSRFLLCFGTSSNNYRENTRNSSKWHWNVYVYLCINMA